METAQNRVLDRLAGVGQVLADALATLRETPAASTAAAIGAEADTDAADDDSDSPTAKVYFVEFPPASAAARTDEAAAPPVAADSSDAYDDPAEEPEIVLTESPAASLFQTDEERSEWAPPSDLPAWWTRGGVQG